MAAKKTELVITCNAKAVKAVFDQLDAQLNKIKKRMQDLNDVGDTKGWTNDMKKEFKDLSRQANALNSVIIKDKDEMVKFGKVMKDLSGSKLKDLKSALQEGKRALNNMSENSKGRAKLVDDLKRIQNQIDKNTGAVKKQNGVMANLATTAKNLATYMIGFAGFNKVKGYVEEVFRSNLKLSDSLANIRKVSGLSSESINQLYRNISKIDTRNTIEMLNELAYTGAKLGIGQNYGVEGLTGFVKAAEQVQMALGEDMGQKALPELSKMVEVMGLIPKYGVEQSMQKAASSIFQLGATSTATGSNIVEFSKRLMGLANVSRISTQDLLALGSASDAMGLMPEVSATAFNKLFTSIQKNHNLIEDSLGMTKGTIKEYYDQGRTMDAIVEIFKRMNETGNMNLLGSIFKDLGSDGARLVNVMATMSDRYDILEKHLKTSRDAFKEGEAVIGEYMIQNQTAAAMMERASNLWAKAFTNPEGVDMVKQMAQAWYDLSKEMTQSEALMGSLHTSINAIAAVISTLIKLFPILLRFGMTFGAVFAFKMAYTGVIGIATAFGALVKSIRLATGAMGAFNVVMSSNIFWGIASAVAAVATLMWDYADAAEEAAKREKERHEALQKAIQKSRDNIEIMLGTLKSYKTSLDKANLSEKQKLGMIADFKKDYQDYLDYLGVEVNSALDLAKAYTKVVEALKLKKAYEERENVRQQENGNTRMDRMTSQFEVVSAARKMGIEGIDKEWLEKNQKRGSLALYRELMEKQYGVKAISQDDEKLQFKYVNDKIVDAGTSSGPRAKVRYKTESNLSLYNALAEYIRYFRQERDTNKKIDEEFLSEFPELKNFNIDEFNRKVDEARWKRKGSLENDALDKDELAKQKKEQAERKKALRKDMEDAQKESTAVINAIEEFYRLQETAIEQLVADGKMTREEANKMVEYLRNRKDLMLMNARRAISGKESDFETLRKDINKDVLRPNDSNSQRALNTIQTIDVKKAAEQLARFDGGKDVFDLNSGAFTQAMLKNAAQNELNIQRRQAAVAQEIDKLLLQYQFVEQAQRDFGDKLVKLGLITDGYDKVVKQLADDTEIVANTRDVQALAEKIVGMDSRLYNVNENDANELANMIRYLTTNQQTGKREGFASIFPQLDEWLKNPEKYIEPMQSLYQTMIEMDNNYYEALKKNYDREKKIFAERWQNMGWTQTEERTDQRLEMESSLRTIQGNGMNFGQTYGFADTIADDPEIARIKNRIYYRALELEDMKANNATQEAIMQKQNDLLKAGADLATAVSQQIADRISKVQTLSEPLNDFGEEVGQMLGEQWQDISRDGKLSFGEMARNMGIEYAKLTLKMASENLIKKLQQGLYYKQMELQEMQHQVQLTNIQMQGAMARQQAQMSAGATLQGIKATQDASEIGQEGSKATIMTMFGISSGAAKTIAKLGYWGIPLIGVITSILMGLLNSAKATASTATESSSSSSSSSSSNIRLVSGMLAYDSGNLTASPSSRRRYVTTDGRVYTATPDAAPADGLVDHPIATTVQGKPALVAEEGPEIVVGRKTTAAIRMNEPELIDYLANYEQRRGRYLPYDAGTTVPSVAAVQQPSSAASASVSETLTALSHTISLLQRRLDAGIPCSINMFGDDGLYESQKRAASFMKQYEG